MDNDLISRKAALDALNELRKLPWHWYNDPQNFYRKAMLAEVSQEVINEVEKIVSEADDV